MNSRLTAVIAFFTILLSVLMLTPVAWGQQCEETKTIFADVSVFGRKDRAAENMTKRHREMAAKGWRYADMEVYTENSDLEGFYVTYVRTVPCGAVSE